MKIKLLFLDDIRNPHLQYQYNRGMDPSEITWVKSYDEFCDWIEENGLPEEVSFDHDLGDFRMVDGVRVEKTGMDCAKFLVEYCMDENQKLPSYSVHSANVVGAENINNFLQNFLKNGN